LIAKEEVYSDYWLDDVFEQDSGYHGAINTDLIKLASSRRLISNFVNILTGKNIPINFSDNALGKDSFVYGLKDWEEICLSANLEERKDFDIAVGLSLHEGSHILLTDFDLVKTIWQKVPEELYDIAKEKSISNERVLKLLKLIFNVVEDRYIDFFVYSTSPGYRGYYTALYDKYFNSKFVDVGLKSKDFRDLSISSYETRIINITNANTDLDALPGLRKIFDIIDLNNIQRLKTTNDRFDIACKVTEIILRNILTDKPKEKEESFKDGDKDSLPEVESDSINTQPSTAKPQQPQSLSKTNSEKIEKAIQKQKDFLNGNIKKKRVKIKDKKFLDLIEKNNIGTVMVGEDYKEDESSSLDKIRGTECIFVKNLTKDLIENESFPLSSRNVLEIRDKDYETMIAVKRGIILGKVLGGKLQIRNEENHTKFLRRTSGKLEKRTLFELAWDSNSIFSSKSVDKYKKINIHISVDASSSMRGKKWVRTMTGVVAICKATSMVSNIDVTVSFRTTVKKSEENHMPYVILAYDSTKDKFSKVANLFPYLVPSGFTPEGLAFEAIIKNIKNPDTDSKYYFINLSDGEPFIQYEVDGTTIYYRNADKNNSASQHTRRQVTKIKNKGYEFLSYFIKREHALKDYDPLYVQFKRMYGADACYINIENIVEIAKTLNAMFLKKFL